MYGLQGGGAYTPGGYIPSIANLGNYNVVWNQWEATTQSLYDSISYPAAGTAQLTFFALPQGQGTGFGGSTKTQSDTNMQLAGQLPANQMFLIREIEVNVQVTTPTVTAQMPAVYGTAAAAQLVNDAYIIYRSGNLQFQIGSKLYLAEAPLEKFPPQTQFVVEGGTTDTTTAAAASQSRVWYPSMRGRPYVLTPNNLLLQPNQNFVVTLNWPEGVQAITNPARIFVNINGWLYRKAQ